MVIKALIPKGCKYYDDSDAQIRIKKAAGQSRDRQHKDNSKQASNNQTIRQVMVDGRLKVCQSERRGVQ